jgi:hypothetical protein
VGRGGSSWLRCGFEAWASRRYGRGRILGASAGDGSSVGRSKRMSTFVGGGAHCRCRAWASQHFSRAQLPTLIGQNGSTIHLIKHQDISQIIIGVFHRHWI